VCIGVLDRRRLQLLRLERQHLRGRILQVASALYSPAVTATLDPTPVGPLRIDARSSGLRLSLVIPTYNERANIAELVARLTELLDASQRGRYELILVDDDSPDRTWELGLELRERFPHLRVIRRLGERGLSTAVVRGWQASRGEVLAVIDADLQHPPEITVRLFEEIERGADLAVASRNVEGGGVSNWSAARRVLSRGAQLIGLIVLPGVLGSVTDPMSGYFMVRRDAIADVTLSPLGYKILIEVIGRGRAETLAEVGYVFREREEGESKVTWRLYVDYLRHLLRLRFG
jgi:dolichol-phosphate mannosyltransferase